jgi:hypothetical protein
MAMLNDRLDECVATVDHERMAIEIVFRLDRSRSAAPAPAGPGAGCSPVLGTARPAGPGTGVIRVRGRRRRTGSTVRLP